MSLAGLINFTLIDGYMEEKDAQGQRKSEQRCLGEVVATLVHNLALNQKTAQSLLQISSSISQYKF